MATGALWRDLVDEEVRHPFGTQVRFIAGLTTPEPGPDVVFSSAHHALAREAAARSKVLLKNEPVDGRPVLPLDFRRNRRRRMPRSTSR